MMVTPQTVRAFEFACHSAACRPPRSGGTGGSSPKGRSKKPTTPYEIMKARESRQAKLAQTNRYRKAQGWNELEV